MSKKQAIDWRKFPDLKLKIMDEVITRRMEQHLRRIELLEVWLAANPSAKLSEHPDPETRLAWKLVLYWLRAIQLGDSSWMKAHIKEMERVEDVENLERLQKLCDWAKEHPPKPQPPLYL
jgi:hypothetical protein